MERYYVNTNKQSNGDHEVHKESCTYLPGSFNRVYLGTFAKCSDAVEEARKKYEKVNGCFFCCFACHTR